MFDVEMHDFVFFVGFFIEVEVDGSDVVLF